MTRTSSLLPVVALPWVARPTVAATEVDYRPISHRGEANGITHGESPARRVLHAAR